MQVEELEKAKNREYALIDREYENTLSSSGNLFNSILDKPKLDSLEELGIYVSLQNSGKYLVSTKEIVYEDTKYELLNKELRKLVNKDIRNMWDTECQKSYERLQNENLVGMQLVMFNSLGSRKEKNNV